MAVKYGNSDADGTMQMEHQQHLLQQLPDMEQIILRETLTLIRLNGLM